MSTTPRYETFFEAPPTSSNRRSKITTGGSKDHSPLFVVSIIDNKAREVGLAAMNLKAATVSLTQFTENSTTTYNNICNMLQAYSPCAEIILPKTIENSKLALSLKEEFPDTQISFVPRKFYNETKGHVMIKQLAIKECTAIESEVSKKYLCVSALSALIDYIEYIQSITYATQSLKITYKPLTGHLLVDASSVFNLELVMNLKTGKKEETLLGVLDHTKTPMGSRLLRYSILQPLRDISTINTRLDCIQEMLENEQGFFNLANAFSGIIDMDHLLTQFTYTHKKSTPKTGQSSITNLIFLKKSLETLRSVVSILRGYDNQLLLLIHDNLNDSGLGDVITEIDKIIDEDITISKNALNMQTQKCFAVKAGINGLLDVARRQYTEIIEEMNMAVRKYKERTGIASLKLQYNTRRGYYLSFDAKTILSPDSKRLFIQTNNQTKRTVCSTEELNSINLKIKDILEEIFLLTDTVVDDLICTVRKNLHSLFKAAESIALLDMLFSFATHVTLSSDYVRPEFTLDGPIAIKSGRHPILDKTKTSSGIYIPNDTYLCESSNFQILTGANMSGKSTYIRQIALLTIMAHVGCYVPAKFASFRVVDKLFTRIGTGDNAEANASSFMVEMKETAYIIQNATNRSLILMDELGRGTSNIEGNSIAWSICEYLMSTQAYSVFVTHYMQLVELETLYPNVKNYHCMVTTSEGRLNFMYNISEGSCNDDNYGIKLARMLGLPEKIVQEAEEISTKVLQEREKKSEENSEKSLHVDLKRASFQFAHRLSCLKHSSLDLQTMKQHLMAMKNNYKAFVVGPRVEMEE